MAKPEPKSDPELTRALIRAVVIDGVLFAIGVAAYFMTQQIIWLIIPAFVGSLVFLGIYLPALKAWKQRQADRGANSPIVEDGF
jgi:hypothetical protein